MESMAVDQLLGSTEKEWLNLKETTYVNSMY